MSRKLLYSRTAAALTVLATLSLIGCVSQENQNQDFNTQMIVGATQILHPGTYKTTTSNLGKGITAYMKVAIQNSTADFYTIKGQQQYDNFVNGTNFTYIPELSQKNITLNTFTFLVPETSSYYFVISNREYSDPKNVSFYLRATYR